MAPAVVLAFVLTCSMAAFVVGHLLTKQRLELDLHDAEQELRKRLYEAMAENRKLEDKYREMAAKLKYLGDSNASADEFNKLWQEIHKQLSSPG